jgi:TetR/AcrR family fatty acid metabolism transcriptional regulator
MMTERQLEIINASMEIIAELGIQGLTIKNISSKISISEPAIYRHFNSKIEILGALLDYYKSLEQNIHGKILYSEANAIKQIQLLFKAQLDIFVKQPSLLAVIFAEEIFQNEKILADRVYSIMKINEEILSTLLLKGQAMGLIRKDMSNKSMTFVFMGTLRLFVTQWRLSEFSFDLIKEGDLLLSDIEKLLTNQA